MPATDNTDAMLAERAKTHGDYTEQTVLCQGMKDIMRATTGWSGLQPYQKETLEMVALKISRILNGASNVEDHWEDIVGYARLAATRVSDANQLALDFDTEKLRSKYDDTVPF